MPGFAFSAQTRAVGCTAAGAATAGTAGAVKAKAAKPAMARILRAERDTIPPREIAANGVGPFGAPLSTVRSALAVTRWCQWRNGVGQPGGGASEWFPKQSAIS
ncbi:hypothetical protein GCM10027360_53960 [Amycolatopsis echigonensis]